MGFWTSFGVRVCEFRDGFYDLGVGCLLCNLVDVVDE